MSVTDLSKKKVLFIGAGNMAEALMRGMLKAGVSDPSFIRVSDIDAGRITHFQQVYGIGGSDKNSEEARNADIVVIAVKPQVVVSALKDITNGLPRRALVVSVAAGITTCTIESILDAGTRVIRIMPNSPALVGRGAAAFACGSCATENDAEMVIKLFESVGIVLRVEESMLDAVTALSGSGPAYVFYLIESMLKAGMDMGLKQAVANDLAVATVEGAACMLAETGLDPQELRRRVTSEGGTTAAAIEVLDRADMQEHVVEAIRAAEKRSKELSSIIRCG